MELTAQHDWYPYQGSHFIERCDICRQFKPVGYHDVPGCILRPAPAGLCRPTIESGFVLVYHHVVHPLLKPA